MASPSASVSPALILSFALLLAVSCTYQLAFSRLIEVTTDGAKAKQKPLVPGANRSVPVDRVDPSKVVRLSQKPRVYLYEGFLSDEECDHLISLADGKLQGSGVSDGGAMGNLNKSSSTGIVVRRGLDDIVRRIEERISAWTFLPTANGEQMRIVRYGQGKRYSAHDDRSKQTEVGFAGRRMATVVMYLSNVTRGGETVFSSSHMRDGQVKWSSCTSAVKPVRGNAILLFGIHPDATPDESSLHGECPVLEGEKWSAVKWIRVRAYLPASDADESGCSDEEESCPRWAAAGECRRNPVYMLGTPDYYGSCRKSCGAC